MGVACLVKNENLDQTGMFGLAVRALGTAEVANPFTDRFILIRKKIILFVSFCLKQENVAIIQLSLMTLIVSSHSHLMATT